MHLPVTSHQHISWVVMHNCQNSRALCALLWLQVTCIHVCKPNRFQNLMHNKKDWSFWKVPPCKMRFLRPQRQDQLLTWCGNFLSFIASISTDVSPTARIRLVLNRVTLTLIYKGLHTVNELLRQLLLGNMSTVLVGQQVSPWDQLGQSFTVGDRYQAVAHAM